jgi:hypothetical protein
MIERVRKEIHTIRKSAASLLEISQQWPSLRRNAEIIMIFAGLLEFTTPHLEEEDGRDQEDPHGLP